MFARLLNKADLFEKKIATKNIADVSDFEDYTGRPHHYEDGVAYFVEKFLARNHQKHKNIHHHVTCLTDSNKFNEVFNACKNPILEASLAASGSVVNHVV